MQIKLEYLTTLVIRTNSMLIPGYTVKRKSLSSKFKRKFHSEFVKNYGNLWRTCIKCMKMR